MRDLTQKEIDDAPDWANYYFINMNDKVSYDPYKCNGYKPIPRKEFDISEYEFSDCDIQSVEIDGYANNEYLHFDFKQETNELTHSKDDVIAMANALKVTASDLNTQ